MENNQADTKERSNDDDGEIVRDMASTLRSPSEWLLRYNRLLDLYPLQTKMCTSFLVSAFGSALGSYSSAMKSKKHGQIICKSKRESKLSKINWVDVLAYAIHGALINTPICHYWYEWLSVHGPSSNTANVLVDQLVVQPPLLACKFDVLY